MDPAREQLIQRAKELNTLELPVLELQERIREVCSEYLIEAKVNVDLLLRHHDWRMRSAALDMVWWWRLREMVKFGSRLIKSRLRICQFHQRAREARC